MELWETAVSLFREGGAIATLALGLWLILTGRLVPERYYLDMIKQRDDARAGEREATEDVTGAARDVHDIRTGG